MISFTVPGPPVPKGRPRFTKQGRAYTPAKTRAYEALVAEEGEKERIRQMANIMAGALRVEIEAVFPIPKSWPKWKRNLCDFLALHHTTKPDADNVGKSITDGLNGVIWKDDSQICALEVLKTYGDDPCVIVHVYSVAGPHSGMKKKSDL